MSFPATSWWKLRRGRAGQPLRPPCYLISAVDGGGLLRRDATVHSLIQSLTHSQLSLSTHEPIWHWERKRFSLFNPHYSWGADSIWRVSEPCSVHLLLPPAATYLPFSSTLWLQLFFFILFFLRAKRKRVIVFLDEWMVGQMDERMDGHNLIDRQHDITAPPESQGSVLALTVRDVRGKPMEEEKQEVMCNSLYSYSVKTQTTTEGK